MKNLTIKKVALGVFLAGYATSSAFAALTPAISNEYIFGNRPIFKTTNDNTPHAISVRMYKDKDGTDLVKDNQKVKVGDYMYIKFKLEDTDGDSIDATADILKDTIKVLYTTDKTMATPWNSIEAKKLPDYEASFNDTTNEGYVRFQLTSAFVGAQKVGFTILERTKYGAPYANNYLMVTDITAITLPNKKELDEKNPDKTLPDNESEIGHQIWGPGQPANGGFPIEGDTTKLGIFKVDTNTGKVDGSVNYTKEGTPRYKDKFAAVVWIDDGGDTPANANNNKFDDKELEMTSSYEFKWFLDGTYTDPDDSTKSVSAVEIDYNTAGDPDSGVKTTGLSVGVGQVTTTGDSIELGSVNGSALHNSLYSAVKGKDDKALLAGVQGYKLKVYAK